MTTVTVKHDPPYDMKSLNDWHMARRTPWAVARDDAQDASLASEQPDADVTEAWMRALRAGDSAYWTVYAMATDREKIDGAMEPARWALAKRLLASGQIGSP